MYCKKCNVNVKKDKKVCPHCGTALTPGEVKGNQKARVRRIVIIAAAAAVLVIGAFLTIFLIARVPGELKGTWYEQNGYGYVKFEPNGVIEMTSMSTDPQYGKYQFSSVKDQGTIWLSDSESTFTCDGTTLNWDGTIMTKTYVEQKSFDFSNMLNQLG